MPNFEDIYGKTAGKMDEGEFKIAVLGLLDLIIKRLDVTNGKVKCVQDHKVYFRVIATVMGCVIFPVLVWLIIKALGGSA